MEHFPRMVEISATDLKRNKRTGKYVNHSCAFGPTSGSVQFFLSC